MQMDRNVQTQLRTDLQVSVLMLVWEEAWCSVCNATCAFSDDVRTKVEFAEVQFRCVTTIVK